MKRAVQVLIIVLCLAFSAAAIYNVFADNGEAERMAATLACGAKPGCQTVTTRVERTPFGQSFTIEKVDTPKRTADVMCRRAYVMVGEYHCALR
jgi:hypothetical protein